MVLRLYLNHGYTKQIDCRLYEQIRSMAAITGANFIDLPYEIFVYAVRFALNIFEIIHKLILYYHIIHSIYKYFTS